MDLETVGKTALSAAREAGGILMDRLGKARVVRQKGAIDLVTEADLASEKAILERITGAFPDHAVLAEEKGSMAKESPYTWIVDPLDGTTNYAHRIPLFTISIAFAREADILFGLVYNPAMDELFRAEKGKGAFLNDEPITVSGVGELSNSLLVTGFPYNLATMLDELVERFGRCLAASQGVRRLGSAALDLCYVACGRFEGFWEQNLHPWDTAAGTLIVEEAGGRVTTFDKGPYTPYEKQILATNGRIHDMLSSVLTAEE
ncbi:MAG: inositol monophosphatase [Deltaproteobacteria bacterium]|nr:inositol monophosphatase [Deltaproteobacteria bacterium]